MNLTERKNSARSIGKRIPSNNAFDKVIGLEKFTGDLFKKGMIYVYPVSSPFPHGIIHHIDVREARSIPGIISIISAADIPGENLMYPSSVDAQPFLASDRVRSLGDVICLIAAEEENIAKKAAKHIRFDIEELPIIKSPEEALRQDAVKIHPKGNQVNHVKIRHGDIISGFNQADIIVEGNYSTPFVQHGYIEPDAALSFYDDSGTLIVNVGTQGIYNEHHNIVRGLSLPEDKVRVIQPAIGGAFGGREETNIGFFVALVTYLTKKPAKMVWSREQVFMLSNTRHSSNIYMKTGATKDGILTALQAELIYDTGAYAFLGPDIVAFASSIASGPYVIPNAWIDGKAVYTNNLRAGSMRGWGAPQVAFAWESQMDRLAIALNIHPLVFRWKNAVTEGSITINGYPLPGGVGMKETILKMAELQNIHLSD